MASLLTALSRHQERAPFVDAVLRVLSLVIDAAGELETPASNYEAVLQMLDQPEVLAELRKCDPLAAARLRGRHLQARLLEAEGGTCTAEQFGQLVGITRQAVDKRRKVGTLIGMSLGKRGYAYPVWQAGLEDLGLVLSELRDYTAWAQLAFMLTPNVWLDEETPLTMLHRGETERVREAAALYGEQIAV